MSEEKKVAKKKQKVVISTEVKPESPKLTKSDIIWNKIKDLQINLFALSGVSVASQCIRLVVSDDVVHMRLKVSAALPLIEEAIQYVNTNMPIPGEKIELDVQKDYIVISSATK